MEWHEVTEPEQDDSFDGRVATVLAVKDRRIEQLKTTNEMLFVQLEEARSRRTTMFSVLGLVALVNLLSALHNLGVFP